MQGQSLGPHEAMEIHELLVFKTACVAKTAVMQGMVKDPQLGSLLKEDVARGARQLRDLQGIIQGVSMQGR